TRIEWSPFVWKNQLHIAEKLGITSCAIEGDFPKRTILHCFRRKTLSEINGKVQKKNLKKTVAGLRSDFDWVSIEPSSIKVLVDAIAFPQVDAIMLTASSPLKLAHQKYLALLRDHSKILEIDLNPFFSYRSKQKEITKLLKILNLVRQKPPQMVFTISDPNPFSFRRYRNLQSLGNSLGIDINYSSLRPFIENIKRNRKRREGKLISGDIEVDN
ncbi:MAG: hypothetical protein D6732_22200, partial [Methanobacteriota archaeon]